MIDNEICDKEFIGNRSNCECECGKSCGVRENLNYENCKCRKSLIDKSVEECSEHIEKNEIHSKRKKKWIYNSTLNYYGKNV